MRLHWKIQTTKDHESNKQPQGCPWGWTAGNCRGRRLHLQCCACCSCDSIQYIQYIILAKDTVHIYPQAPLCCHTPAGEDHQPPLPPRTESCVVLVTRASTRQHKNILIRGTIPYKRMQPCACAAGVNPAAKHQAHMGLYRLCMENILRKLKQLILATFFCHKKGSKLFF